MAATGPTLLNMLTFTFHDSNDFNDFNDVAEAARCLDPATCFYADPALVSPLSPGSLAVLGVLGSLLFCAIAFATISACAGATFMVLCVLEDVTQVGLWRVPSPTRTESERVGHNSRDGMYHDVEE